MTINRNEWLRPFTKESVPKWPCPFCNRGYLEIYSNSLNFSETQASIQLHSHEGWDPDWIEYKYIALFLCNSKSCQEIVSSCGTGRVTMLQISDRGDFEFEDAFYPEYFSTSPLIFSIPTKCPQHIKNDLLKAFSLFWSDCSSAGNKIRSCVEGIIDHKKVPKTQIKNRKRHLLSLHKRIERFSLKNRNVSDHLLAIKWLGNVGSHSSVLSKDDILDAFEIMEHIINELYLEDSKRIQTLTKNIIKRKGPIKR